MSRLDDLITRHPVPSMRPLAWVVMILLAALIFWASGAQRDEVSSAEGEIVPIGQIKVIQHLEGGIIELIHVANGSTVEEGDQSAGSAQPRRGRGQPRRAAGHPRRTDSQAGAARGRGAWQDAQLSRRGGLAPARIHPQRTGGVSRAQGAARERDQRPPAAGAPARPRNQGVRGQVSVIKTNGTVERVS